MNGVRALREAFPNVPIVADLKTMDGGWLEAEMMAKAGATHVVVMERAHPETIKMVVKAGKDLRRKSHGRQSRRRRHGRGGEEVGTSVATSSSTTSATTNGADSPPRASHIPARSTNCGKLWPLSASRPGGRRVSIEQAIRTPIQHADLVVLGAPLTIDADSFKTASGNLEDKLRLVCEQVHAYGDLARKKAGKVSTDASRSGFHPPAEPQRTLTVKPFVSSRPGQKTPSLRQGKERPIPV